MKFLYLLLIISVLLSGCVAVPSAPYRSGYRGNVYIREHNTGYDHHPRYHHRNSFHRSR